MSKRALVMMLVVALLGLLIEGCGMKSDERVPVRGHVRFHGQPLQKGTIIFTPDIDRGGGTELGIAQIKADGSYQIQTDKGCALHPGWYRVSIVAAERSPGTRTARLPDKYRDPFQSGLERQIQPGHENIFDFVIE